MRLWGRPDVEPIALVIDRLAQTAAGPIAHGLRFSLPPSTHNFRTGDAVAMWLVACWHLLPTPTAPPTLFWTDGPPGALYAFYGDVSAPAFRAILTGVPNSDRIVAVDEGPASAMVRAAARLPPALRAVLDHSNASVASVISRLHTVR